MKYKNVKIEKSNYDALKRILYFHDEANSFSMRDFINQILMNKILDTGCKIAKITSNSI